MTQSKTSFGQHIPIADAQRMYLNFYKIKQRTIDLMNQTLSGDSEALRYHAGRKDQPPVIAPGGPNTCSFLDAAFVFEKTSLHRLMNPSSGTEPDGIIIFLGARNMEDSVDPTGKNSGVAGPCYADVDGRPTLIAFPFTFGTLPDSKIVDQKQLVISLDDGEEHPGTGGGGGNGGGGGSNGGGGGTGDGSDDAKKKESAPPVKLAAGLQPAGTFMPIDRQIPGTYLVKNLEHFMNAQK